MGGLSFIVEIGQAISKGIEIGGKLDKSSSEDPLSALDDAISGIFGSALGDCANEGQVSQIESIGEDGFRNACYESAGEGGAADILMGYCSHPEAVDEILGDSGDQLDAAYQDAMDYMASQGDDDAEDD